MSTLLTVIQEDCPAIEPAESTPAVEQGRLSRAVAKLRSMKQSISASPRFSQVAQLRGLGSAPWLVGFVGSILILNRFVSPIITELAMTTLIAPIAALVLVILGEFDFTKLTTMVTSNAGIVFATGGMIIAALFVQNVVKMALLTKSFTADSHKQYRTYALASMLTPVTTSALWYVATKLGYFLGAKSISLGVIAIFASGAVGEALKSVDPMNATTADLATVASAMSNGLRWGLGFIITIHLYFVFKSYSLVHKTLNVIFDYALKDLTKEKIKSKMLEQVVDDNKRPKFNSKNEPIMEPTGLACLTIIAIAAIAVAGFFMTASYIFSPTPEEHQAELAQEAAEQKQRLEQAWRVACIKGVTYATEEGQAYRLTNADGSSHCTSTVTEKNLRLGNQFSEGRSYRHDVIELDAGGYDQACLDPNIRSDRVDLNDNCRIDNTARRNVRYWLELPEGLPKDVKMPALPTSKVPAR